MEGVPALAGSLHLPTLVGSLRRQGGGMPPSRPPHCGHGSYMNRDLNSNLSCDKVYYTNTAMLLVKHMLCSKLYYQRTFNLIIFLYKIPCHVRVWGRSQSDRSLVTDTA